MHLKTWILILSGISSSLTDEHTPFGVTGRDGNEEEVFSEEIIKPPGTCSLNPCEVIDFMEKKTMLQLQRRISSLEQPCK
jgi:hypothetical protein